MLSTSILITLAATASASLIAERQSACSATHIFIAKGNNEPYPGRQGVLVNAICDGLTSCDYEDILYYNPVEAPYCASVNEGVANGIAQITAYNARCPDAALVVSGYSQGAQIVTDILGGGGGTFFQGCVENTSAGLDPKSAPGNKIAAALVFGNTRHTAFQPYNVLSGAGGQGIFPRTGAQYDALLGYTSVLHDYCVETDPICAGGSDVATHLNYFDIFTNSAAAWVKSQLLAAAAPKPSSTSSLISSTTALPTLGNTVAAPYPTASGYKNGTSTVVSCPAIPTATLTYYVTVPCITANTAQLSSFMSTYSASGPASTSVVAQTSSFASATATSSGSRNGTQPTQATFTGAADSVAVSWLVGLAAAGFMALLI